MELLFNLFWVVLSTVFVGLWLITRHQWGNDVLRPRTHMQIAALAVLIMVLFPVVSLTDDLLASTAPAEVEHLVRRDLFDHVESDIHTASVLSAAWASFQIASGLQIISKFMPPMEIGIPSEEPLSIIGNRPPPHV